MKVVSVSEAAPQLVQLVQDAINGEVVFLQFGDCKIELTPRLSNSEDDFTSPELEAELLRGLEGKPIPYKEGMFQELLLEIRQRKRCSG